MTTRYARDLKTGQLMKQGYNGTWPPVSAVDEQHRHKIAVLELVPNIFAGEIHVPGIGNVWLWEQGHVWERVMEIEE